MKPVKTISQKIIARSAGKSFVLPGDVVTDKIDLAFAHNSSGGRRGQPRLERLGIEPGVFEKLVRRNGSEVTYFSKRIDDQIKFHGKLLSENAQLTCSM